MDALQRTPDGRWVLYHAATGRRVERWPVDARAMLGCGEYTTHPPEGTEATAVTVDATPEQPAAPPPSMPGAHPLGVPLVVTRAHEAAPSAPFAEPVRSAKGWKARAAGR